MANLATLTPFPKGVSGNPSGRPKGALSLTSRVRAVLEANVTEATDFADELTKVIMNKALEGDERMIRLIWSYIDGKPKQNLSLEQDTKATIMFDRAFFVDE